MPGNMRKTIRKAVAAVLAAGLGIGAVAGGMVAYRNLSKKPVNAYSVSDFAMSDYWGDSSETYGMVTTEGMQKVNISETQTVTKIFVKEGQEVKKGDKLLSYDTTLTSLDVKRAELSVQRKELQLTQAKKELTKIKNMRPSSGSFLGAVNNGIQLASANMVVLANITDGRPLADDEAVRVPVLIKGEGSEEKPYVYLCPANWLVNQNTLQQIYMGVEEISAGSGNTDPEDPKPEDPKPENPQPEDPKPENPQPEDPKPENPKPEDPKPEDPQPADPQPETPQPEDPQPETPQPETPPVEPVPDENGQETSATPITERVVYAALLFRENDSRKGMVTDCWGMKLRKVRDEVGMSLYTPDLDAILADDSENGGDIDIGGDIIIGGGGGGDLGSGYTSAELAQMRNEKELEIRNLEIEISLAKIDLERKQKEFNDGIVYSSVDGTIVTVRDANEAYMNSEPVIEVSGGGGYYIEGSMSEMELGKVQVGQEVNVNSWETGTSCTGVIQSISEYPSSNGSSWSDGNSNVSYYPFTVFVEADAGLREYDYVNMSYTAASEEDQDCWYLENQFIRQDGGSSYVFVLNGDGKLEKRVIRTGRNLWGSYTQILGGLSMDEYVAFPYGDAEDGAKAQIADSSELYN